MFVSLLKLSRDDLKNLNITDSYSIHRVVYDLFSDIRTEDEKKASLPSGLLYADKGGDFNKREILILSDRLPQKTNIGLIESKAIDDAYLSHSHYRFEVVINPTKRDSKTGKLVAIRGRQAITDWFLKKTSSWGFSVRSEGFLIEDIWVDQFYKSKHEVVHSGARLSGELFVETPQLFIQSFKKGIGRGRAFGFGLLQIIPFTKHII